jgi:glycine betaine/choline ABC-type transport system substrate-binding protein
MMKTPRLPLAFLPLLLAALTGCQRTEPVRVGAERFTEQRILAEATVQLLRDRGIPAAPVVTYPDTFTSYAMLRDGRIDVKIDYAGTGLYFLGQPVPQGKATLAGVRDLYRPLGLEWLIPGLGFDNGYTLLMTPERAGWLRERVGKKEGEKLSIEDLRKIPGGGRVACPSNYTIRPGDGLGALLRHYDDVKMLGRPILLDDVNARVKALLEGRVDVIVVYDTDGAPFAPELGLQTLEDTRNFFPPYDTAFVVRRQALERIPSLGPTLQMLSGKLTEKEMRKLNAAVEIHGRPPAEVARTFLIDQDLLTRKKPALRVAVADGDQEDLGELEDRAKEAVLDAFPDRQVEITRVADPVAEVFGGKARLALLGAERFFTFRHDDPPLREVRLEAAAVVGTRKVLVIQRAPVVEVASTTGLLGSPGAPSPFLALAAALVPARTPVWDPLSGKVGVANEQSGSGQVGREVLAVLGRTPAMHAGPGDLLDEVANGGLDAAVVLYTPGMKGEDAIGAKLKGGGLVVRSLDGWLTPERAVQIPYLRPSSFSLDPLTGEGRVVEVLGEQVVLAGAAPDPSRIAAVGGPAAALPVTGVPLTRKEIRALAEATGIPEAPDPAIPSAWSGGARPYDEGPAGWEPILYSLANAFAAAFLIWLAWLVVRPAPPARATTGRQAHRQ